MNIKVYGRDSYFYKVLFSNFSNEDTIEMMRGDVKKKDITDDDIVVLISNNLEQISKVIRTLSPSTPLLLFNRNSNYDFFDETLSLIIILQPPFDIFSIRTAINKLKLFVSKRKELDKVIAGKSLAMTTLKSQIIISSLLTIPIHLLGESGVGKTMAAKLIHSSSSFTKPPVYINCANLNSSLAESDLFGHIKGSYTGALTERKGLLYQADESTLILDEIENLSLDMQSKLLDTIENGRYRTIGSDSIRKSSFRLITISQKSLEELLEENKIRKDFYYRISSLLITIPPLRERMEDIPQIINYYEEKMKIKKGRIKNYTPLMNTEWNGNVRELLHYLDRFFSMKVH